MVSKLTIVMGLSLALLVVSAAYQPFLNWQSHAAVQTGKTRTYYIAADEVAWDYAPTNANQVTGQPFGETEEVFVQNGKDRVGKTYTKAVYREYTDESFTTLKERPEQWKHLGVLGPVIRTEVGDTIKVVFKNNARFAFSMHPHGVFYGKDSEGAGYNDGTSGKHDDAVPPGEMHTYIWHVPARAGPGPADPSSIAWMYHSHVDEPGDANAGLAGPIIITRQGQAKADGSPKDVDREFVTLFTVFDENRSPYLDYNIQTYTGRPATVKPDSDEFVESNLMHSINGYVYGNLPGLEMYQGERVRWYTMALGTEVDLHTPHWHGQTLLTNGMRTDMVELLPMSMKTLDMSPDDPGIWLFHCSVNDHIDAGMQALFKVK